MLPINLRKYQDDAIAAIYTYFANHSGNPIVALPTGTGKSVVIAALLAGIFRVWPNQRVLILTHRKELIDQNSKKLLQLWPTAPMGIFSAGLGDKTYWMPITFGGIQSVYRALDKFGMKFDLVIIDECHLISPKSLGMYGAVLEFLKSINPKIKYIGFTATPYRLKQGLLTDETYNTDGDAIPALFTDIVYDLTDVMGFERLLSEGYLCKPVVKPTHTQIDISNVKIQAGEFNQKQLEKAVDVDSITRAAVAETIWYGRDRWAWLVFATSIEHAEHIATMMQWQGVSCEAVHSKLPSNVADARLADFKAGRLRCLVNNDKLTTGFDHPPVDLIAMIRHTMSTSLWVQMVGRGTRPYDYNNPEQYIPGYEFTKPNCLVLDFAKNIERLGPINNPVVPNKKTGKKGDMPVKICPSCGVYNFGAARYCDNCGHEFEFSMHIETKHDDKSAIYEEFDPNFGVERFSVINAVYKSYQRDETSAPTLRASYMCLNDQGAAVTVNEFVPFESERGRNIAVQWFAQRHAADCPLTVDEALKFHPYFRTPNMIRVRKNGKYYNILAAEF